MTVASLRAKRVRSVACFHDGVLAIASSARRPGRRSERETKGTLLLDEASMLDLELAAALFRAVGWQHIRRLILVGDPGQLPPNRAWPRLCGCNQMSAVHPANLGRLKRNLRQLLNNVHGEGTAIVALSALFIVDDADKSADGADTSRRPD
jgi:ATP-dependent exoDNAse (exonuclease V) alpha subunit